MFTLYLIALAILVVHLGWNVWDYARVNKKLWAMILLASILAAGAAKATGGEGRHDTGTGGSSGGADRGPADDVSDPGNVKGGTSGPGGPF